MEPTTNGKMAMMWHQPRRPRYGGTMVDGDTYPVCELCEYVDWDRRTEDGDPCPKCEEATR